MSDTPRTDAVRYFNEVGDEVVPPSFARTLERENAELVKALKWMREEYAKLPHSLGYTFTHLPKVDALLAKLGEA